MVRMRRFLRTVPALLLAPLLWSVVPPTTAHAAEPGVVAVVRNPDGMLSVESFATAASTTSSVDAVEVLEAVRARPGVVAADFDVPTRETATDAYRAKQWPLDVLKADTVWPTSTGDDVTVAVLDTGVEGGHPDLRRALLKGTDLTGGTGDGRRDRRGHGTHVAGIVAATRGNDIGTAGLAPDVRILPVQVLDDSGGGLLSWAAQGIIWATDQGADVITMSLGASRGNQVLDAAVTYAIDHGVVLVAASGNQGAAKALWPAAHADVISVGASTPTDGVASFSNRDADLDLVAPGVSVLSTCVGAQWCLMQGTSMATPYVAASVAAILAVRPDLAPDEVRALLRATAVDRGEPGHDHAYGHGRVDTAAAMRAALVSADPFLSSASGLRRVGAVGDTRAVAVATSQTVFSDGAELAVVARDDVFADSLTGAALAGQRGPVLFTGGGPDAGLDAATAAELKRVLVPGAPVYVLGGSAAVSDRAFAEIADLGFRVERIGGLSRTQTAVQIADVVVGADATVPRVLLARADHWADAVTGSAYAAASSTPVLLTASGRLDATTAAWLSRHEVSEVVVLGGEVAVSDGVAEEAAQLAQSVRRVGGLDRAATAAAVARDLWRRRTGVAGDAFVVVEGYSEQAWGSAVAAAVLSAGDGAPQLLVAAGKVPTGTADYLGTLGYSGGRSAQVTAVGGAVGGAVGFALIPLIGR